MNQQRGGDLELAVVILAFVVGGAGVWGFSESLGLDISTGGLVLLGLTAVAALIIPLVWLRVPFRYLSQLAAIGIWVAFWPALNYWAGDASLPEGWPELANNSRPWWSTWYMKVGVIILILALGYGISWLSRRQD